MSLTAERSTQKTAAKAQGTKDDQFCVAQYIVDEVELPWVQLAIDCEMRHGQIRQLNVIHREALTEQFKKNPPHVIELITVLDQGVEGHVHVPDCMHDCWFHSLDDKTSVMMPSTLF